MESSGFSVGPVITEMTPLNYHCLLQITGLIYFQLFPWAETVRTFVLGLEIKHTGTITQTTALLFMKTYSLGCCLANKRVLFVNIIVFRLLLRRHRITSELRYCGSMPYIISYFDLEYYLLLSELFQIHI